MAQIRGHIRDIDCRVGGVSSFRRISDSEGSPRGAAVTGSIWTERSRIEDGSPAYDGRGKRGAGGFVGGQVPVPPGAVPPGAVPPAAGFTNPYAPYSDPRYSVCLRFLRLLVCRGTMDGARPVGAIVLIGLGVLFLLNTMDIFHFDWMGGLWPLLIIGFGVVLFMRRSREISPPPPPPPPGREARNERYIFIHRIKGPVMILVFGITALLDQWNILSFGRELAVVPDCAGRVATGGARGMVAGRFRRTVVRRFGSRTAGNWGGPAGPPPSSSPAYTGSTAFRMTNRRIGRGR